MISWSNAKSISPIFSPLVFVNVHPSSSLFKASWYKRVDSATTPLAYVENLMNPLSLSLSRDKRRIVVVDPEKLRVARRIAHTPALARQSLISFSWKRKQPPPPRTLYSVHILKHDRLQRAAIMYYAFAIVKRVRAPLRALRAPRLSEPVWRSRACSYWCSTTRACVLYVCIHFLQGEKKEREREEVKWARKDCSDDAVAVAFPKLLFLNFFLSFPLSFLRSYSEVEGTRIRRSRETY